MIRIFDKPHDTRKTYNGRPESESYQNVGDVVVMAGGALDSEQYKLDPRHDLANHSPSGFAWNYGGSGPAQLALAILADASGDDGIAIANYMAFKSERIAALPVGPWKITQLDVLEWLASREISS